MLADVQPYSLTQAVIDAATSSGKTVILVDPYKTSRVEFETGYVHEAKISLSVRGWPSGCRAYRGDPLSSLG